MMNYFKKTPHRNQLEREIKAILPALEGSILDVGSQNRRYDYLMNSRPIAIDIRENLSSDIVRGDVNDLPFEDSSFDNIVCLEVLEYVLTPEKAVSEIYRVLAPSGNLVLSVPFMYKTHGDQLRYTENYLSKLFSNFSSVKILPIGNAYTVILDIIFSSIKHIRFTPVRYLLTMIYLPLTFFIPSRIITNTRHMSGYLVIANK